MRCPTPLCAWPLAALPLAALVACGSGTDAPNETPPPSGTTLALTGMAAQGAALAGQTVEARCAAGAGTSAPTAADGASRIEITDGALPCVLRVAAGGVTLHAVAQGSPVANVTPVTDLIVTQLTGADPAAFCATFVPATVTAPGVAAATTATVQMLADGGVDFSGLGDPITDPLTPAVATQLGALNAQMTAAGSSQASLVAAVVTAATAGSDAPALAPHMLLQAAMPGCASLCGGRYRVVFGQSVPAEFETEVVEVDAVAATLTNSFGEVFAVADQGGCRYLMSQHPDEPPVELAVSGSGAVIARFQLGDAVGGYAPAAGLLLPAQTTALADLAGEFNGIGFDRSTDGGPLHLSRSTRSWAADGRTTALSRCDTLAGPCTAADAATLAALTTMPQAAGGYTLSRTVDAWTERLFIYRAGSGERLLAALSPTGSLTVATAKAARTLPPVAAAGTGWTLVDEPDPTFMLHTAPYPMAPYSHTVTAVDATNHRCTRDAVIDFGQNVTRPETVVINEPADGCTHRLPGVVTASDGRPSMVSEWWALPLRGMGISALGLASDTPQLILSVQQP